MTETGAAEHTVPIRVVPGASGLEPKLALVYSSQAGNGLVGAGWSLTGLSIIHRCPRTLVQDNLNAGVSYGSSDRYCLDGQRLVGVSGPYGGDGAEYRTERESFGKVISYGTAGNGPAWFKVWTKAGLMLEYGNTTDSRIEAQGKASVRVYAVNKISDTKGNYLTVSYNEDNANGDYSPARIDYTGNSTTATAAYASVQFVFESRSDVTPRYIGGSMLKIQNRLKNIKTYLGLQAVKDYRFSYSYSPNGGASRLVSITECSGDGLQCINPVAMGWQDPTGVNGLGGGEGAGLVVPSMAIVRKGDINGDGLDDVVYAAWDASWSGMNYYYSFSTGTGLGGATYLGWFPWNLHYALGDFNGDGKADLIIGGSVYLSTGGGFTGPQNWGGAGSKYLAAGDVNGDGFDDFVYANYDGAATYYVYLQLSNGAGFLPSIYVGGFGQPPAALADVNGDGWADLTLASGQILLSTGSGFTGSSWATTYGTSQGPNGSAGSTIVPSFGDVNGDGLIDVFYVFNTFDWSFPPKPLYVQYSTGNGFGSPVYLGSISAWETDNVILFDLNGDGRSDLFIGYAGTKQMAVRATPDVVVNVTDSLGGVTSHTFKDLTDVSVYTKDTSAVWPVRDLLQQGPVSVTSSASKPTGTGSNYTSNYFYRGAKAHLRGGGFLGFRSVESVLVDTGVKTTMAFRQDYPFHGLPTTVTQTQSGGAVINQATNVWTDAQYVNATGKYHRSDLTQATETRNDLNGAALPTLTTTTTYDAYGNATAVTVTTGDAYSKTTTNAYANDLANWLLGRLTRSAVQSSGP